MRKFTLFLALMFFIGMQVVQAQTSTITGTVTNAVDGSTIPGVSVVVKGTTFGTTTDLQGKYTLNVPPDSEILIFSFVGMKTTEREIAGQSVINVEMEPEITAIEGVVVTAIGITREKKALGYSVQDVGADEFASDARNDVINSLQGRVAGVEVTSSAGTAGGPSYITIRGATSITGNNQPLFVVDGVPIDNSTSLDLDGFETGDVAGVARGNRGADINPDDVESVSVLKGGAATALYGIRGANGVVLITTKKGKATEGKQIRVDLSSSLTWSQISQVPDLNKAYSQGWSGEWASGNFASWGARMDGLGYSKDPSVWTNPGFDVDGALVPLSEADPALGPARAYDHYDFFQTGVKAINSVNIYGGSTDANFSLSLSDLRDKGVVPNNEYNRNTVKLTGETKVADWFKISGSANYIHSEGDRIQQGSNISGVMLGLLRTPPSFDNSAGYVFPDGTQRNYRLGGGYDNPYWTANKNLWNDKLDRLIGYFQADATITDWLSATYRLGIDNYSEDVKDYVAIYSRNQPSGQVYAREFVLRDINSDLLFNINRDLTSDLSLRATLGWNLFSHYQNYVEALAVGLDVPGFYDISNSSSISAGEVKERLRRSGLFADVGLSWQSQFFLNGTYRHDWSTTLPEPYLSDGFGYYSVNGSWVFTELPALVDNSILSFGKLRASYAKTARDPEPYNTGTYFFQTSGSANGITDGWVQPNGVNFPTVVNAFTYGDVLGSSDLKPETTNTWEIGTELKFLNNRLGLDATYFKSVSSDLLLPVDVDPSSGFDVFYVNAAEMESYGWELMGYGSPVKTSNFSWDIFVNFTSFKNPVTKLAEGVDAVFLGGFVDPQIRAVVGEEYRTIYGYDWERNENGDVLIDAETGYPTGDYNFSVLGKVNPDWTMGITNSFKIYDLSLSFLLDFRQGSNMWNGTRGALYYFGTHADTENREEDYVFEGVKVEYNEDGSYTELGTNDIPVKLDQTWRTSGEGSGFTGPTVDYIEDASWVRLKSLTLNYSFTRLITRSQNTIKKFDLYFTATNLWLNTPYEGIDPETSLLGPSNGQGMDYFNMPGTKSYTLGLRLGF